MQALNSLPVFSHLLIPPLGPVTPFLSFLSVIHKTTISYLNFVIKKVPSTTSGYGGVAAGRLPPDIAIIIELNS